MTNPNESSDWDISKIDNTFPVPEAPVMPISQQELGEMYYDFRNAVKENPRVFHKVATAGIREIHQISYRDEAPEIMGDEFGKMVDIRLVDRMGEDGNGDAVLQETAVTIELLRASDLALPTTRLGVLSLLSLNVTMGVVDREKYTIDYGSVSRVSVFKTKPEVAHLGQYLGTMNIAELDAERGKSFPTDAVTKRLIAEADAANPKVVMEDIEILKRALRVVRSF